MIHVRRHFISKSGSAEINQRYSVNVGAVWGQMSTGGGQTTK